MCGQTLKHIPTDFQASNRVVCQDDGFRKKNPYRMLPPIGSPRIPPQYHRVQVAVSNGAHGIDTTSPANAAFHTLGSIIAVRNVGVLESVIKSAVAVNADAIAHNKATIAHRNGGLALRRLGVVMGLLTWNEPSIQGTTLRVDPICRLGGRNGWNELSSRHVRCVNRIGEP